jgi:hypothetical protein
MQRLRGVVRRRTRLAHDSSKTVNPANFPRRPVLKTNRLGPHIQVADIKRDTNLLRGAVPRTGSQYSRGTPDPTLVELRVSETYRCDWDSVPSHAQGDGASAVDDVTLGVERELTFESAYSTGPGHDPHDSQFRAMRSGGWPHNELFEAVFEAPIAWMTTADPLCARLIDRSRQRLLAPRLRKVDRATPQRTRRFRRSASRATRLQDFPQTTEGPHDTGGLERKKYR